MKLQPIKTGNDKGSIAVEFAIIFPLLFVLTIAIIEFSVLLYDKAMITNASREGARSGVVYIFDPANPGPPNHPINSEIETVVETFCQQKLLGSSGDSVETIIEREGDEAGDDLTVTVRYPYNFLLLRPAFGLLNLSFATGVTLESTTVMRME